MHGNHTADAQQSTRTHGKSINCMVRSCGHARACTLTLAHATAKVLCPPPSTTDILLADHELHQSFQPPLSSGESILHSKRITAHCEKARSGPVAGEIGTHLVDTVQLLMESNVLRVEEPCSQRQEMLPVAVHDL